MKWKEYSATKAVRFLFKKADLIITTAIITGLIIFICYSLAMKALTTTLWQIGENNKNLKHITESTANRAKENESLKKQIQDLEKKIIFDKKEKYLNNIALKIDGYYSTYASSKGKKHYLVGVRAAFSASEKLFEKGLVKHYAKTPKECALKLLATSKNESNFTYDLICQNYLKDKLGNYIIESDKRKIKKELVGNDFYEYYVIENGKKTKANQYIVSGNLKATKDKSGFWLFRYDENGKEKIKVLTEKELKEKYLCKTSLDYGWLQCNQCNINLSLKLLKKVGLWDERAGRWLLDVEVNALMRILIDDERIRVGWNNPDNCNFDKNFLKMIQNIEE